MATFTSVQSGDFDDPTTWDIGASYPQSLDDFVIVATHTVTVPNGLTVTTQGTVGGTSSANRGVLSIADGGKLTLNGNLVLTDWNELRIAGGGELDINGNNVTVDNSTAEVNYINIVGTAGNRAKVSSSTAGSGNFQRDTGGGMPGIFLIDYCDFVDCGNIQIGNNFFSPNDFSVKHTVFVGCNTTTLGGFQHGDNDYILENIDFRDDRATTNIAIIQRSDGGAASGTGTQSITNITAVANTASILRWELDGVDRSNIVTDRVLHSSVIARGGIAKDSFFRMRTTAGGAIDNGGIDEVRDCYIFSDCDNPHTNSGALDIITRGVIEATYTQGYTDDGDHFIVSPTRSQDCIETVIIEAKSGVLMNALGSATSGTYNTTKCTLYGDYDAVYGSLCRTESGGSWGGTINLQSNLIVAQTTGARGFNIDTAGNDQITLMDYNAWFNVTDQYFGVTSATKTAGVTAGYGGNDINGEDPAFVDNTRNLAKWAGTVTATATADSGVSHLLKINGYNETSKTQVSGDIISETPRDLTDYVRAGFSPTNTAYQGTAHDGGDIGAVAVTEIVAGSAFGGIINGIKTGIKAGIYKGIK